MPRSTPTRKRRRRGAKLVAGFLFLVALAVGAWIGIGYLRSLYPVVLPFDDRCEAQVQGGSVSLTTEQSANAAIIVGEAQRRGLAPRASSIALATAYQESGIRNLDYGDADSVGLFQQRPSQGWGSAEELMDPWYASGKFYEALVKIPGWETADLGEIAQQIQISAYPDAYSDHVTDARQLASALTGETPGAFGCEIHTDVQDMAAAQSFIERAFDGQVTVKVDGQQLKLAGESSAVWSAVQTSIARGTLTGLSSAKVGKAKWSSDSVEWSGDVVAAKSATLNFGS